MHPASSLLALATLLFCLATAGAAELHVALTGNDANPGTAARPLATLEHARDAARQSPGATVTVHRGTWERTASFELTAADSGTTWRAAPGEEVRLSGGRSVPADAWKPVDDPAVLERLDPAARGHVVRTDLKALGIGPLAALPTAFRGAPPVPELFCNDVRCTLARWPNEGWATISKIIEPGSVPRVGDAGKTGGVFEYSGDRPARWRAEAGVWLRGYWCFDWFEETLQVAAIDPAQRRITFAAPTVYGVKQGNPSPRRWYALNLLEELDRPGEYYLDRGAGTLYFWPPQAPGRARVVLSTLNAPVVALQDSSRATLRGFIVEAGLANGIEVTGGSEVKVDACRVRNLRQTGIVVRGGDHHRVAACDIHDTGTGGVVLEGGDRKTLTPAGHEVVNCHIHHYSVHQFTYASAVHLAGVGNLAAHNLIHDAPHMAIGIGGNDMVVEYNVIHDVTTATDDSGALYKGRDPSCRGNVIRYNFWHHIGSPLGHGTAAVYFDDGDGGDQVIGNVFYQCGDPGRGSFGTVFSHGGHDLLAEGNVFIECKRPLGSAPWNDQRWADAMRDPDWVNKLLKQVDITRPPYTTRYPALVGFMDPQPGVPRVSRAVRNLLVGCGEIKSGNWQVDPAENWITTEDPGFVDAAHGDFRFRPDAAVFRHLPAFAPIPFERIGLYADALRPEPPAERWTGGPLRPLPVRSAAAAAAAPARKGPAP
ncbi:MAG: right-handed parallel beta-helix repeat-containing protein, partial [Armatimonadetes bacterium]|nr:right-handed parallel beta-helix repeat-containing protein [Armatimonadota bacterium]